MQKLDENLFEYVKDRLDRGNLGIVDIYEVQGIAELHCYLKTAHQFNPAEVEALMQFKSPLLAAQLCWEENTHRYDFPICDLLRETKALERLPLAEPGPPKQLSVRQQLRAAMKEARQKIAPEDWAKGGDAR